MIPLSVLIVVFSTREVLGLIPIEKTTISAEISSPIFNFTFSTISFPEESFFVIISVAESLSINFIPLSSARFFSISEDSLSSCLGRRRSKNSTTVTSRPNFKSSPAASRPHLRPQLSYCFLYH